MKTTGGKKVGALLPKAHGKKWSSSINQGQFCPRCGNWETSTWERECRWCQLINGRKEK